MLRTIATIVAVHTRCTSRRRVTGHSPQNAPGIGSNDAT